MTRGAPNRTIQAMAGNPKGTPRARRNSLMNSAFDTG